MALVKNHTVIHSLLQYASVEKDGVKLMTTSDFLKSYVGILQHENVNEKTVHILGNLVDQVPTLQYVYSSL